MSLIDDEEVYIIQSDMSSDSLLREDGLSPFKYNFGFSNVSALSPILQHSEATTPTSNREIPNGWRGNATHGTTPNQLLEDNENMQGNKDILSGFLANLLESKKGEPLDRAGGQNLPSCSKYNM